MTTEQLDPHSPIDAPSASATATTLAVDHKKDMDIDKVSAAMGSYMLQGWVLHILSSCFLLKLMFELTINHLFLAQLDLAERWLP